MSLTDPKERKWLSVGKRLARLEAAMRTAILSGQVSKRDCADACLAYFTAAVETGFTQGIEELADFLDDQGIEHLLGTRALDFVFESGVITDIVVMALIERFDSDAAFRAAMIADGWETSVDLWRTMHAAEANSEIEVVNLPAEPTLASMLPSSPLQGDLFAAWR